MKRKMIIPVALVCLALPLMACEGLSGKDGKTISRDEATALVKTLEEKHASSSFVYPSQFHIVSRVSLDQKEANSLAYDTVTDYVEGQYYHAYSKSVGHDYTTSLDTEEIDDQYYFLKDGKYYYASDTFENTGKKGMKETTKADFDLQMTRQKTNMASEFTSDDESLEEMIKNAADPGATESSTSTADPSVYTLAKEQYRSKGAGSLAVYLHLKVTTKEHGYGDEISKVVYSDYLPTSISMSITGKGTLSEAVSGSSEDLTLHDMSISSNATYDWTKATVTYPDSTEYPFASSSSAA